MLSMKSVTTNQPSHPLLITPLLPPLETVHNKISKAQARYNKISRIVERKNLYKMSRTSLRVVQSVITPSILEIGEELEYDV